MTVMLHRDMQNMGALIICELAVLFRSNKIFLKFPKIFWQIITKLLNLVPFLYFACFIYMVALHYFIFLLPHQILNEYLCLIR